MPPVLLLLLLQCTVTMFSEASVTNMVQVSTAAENQVDLSVLRYPPIANYSDMNYFRSQISILSDGRYLVGAINKLYLIRSDLSAADDMLTWEPTNTSFCNLVLEQEMAQQNYQVECSNHIRIHHIQEDNRIVVCGTNAMQPRCRIVMLNDFANMGSLFTPQLGVLPFRPDAKGLIITNVATPNGIVAVSYLDVDNDNFGISYQILNTSTGTIQNAVTYRTITGSINWLRGPATYADYYADNYTADGSLDFYFIFLREQSVEITGSDSQVIYSRVVRLCKNDPGSGSLAGTSMFRAEYFYTYVKALIFCKVARPVHGAVPGSTDYRFNIIQKVSLRHNSTYMIGQPPRERIVYGVFTGPTYGPPGSAICVYSADNTGVNDNGIFTVFNEEYHNLRPGQTSCTANNIPNDNPFTCDSSTHDSRRGEPVTEVLMSPSVAQLTTQPLVVLEGIMASHIYTTQAYIRINGSDDLALMDVMLIGTDKGKILKIVMTYNGTHHVPLVAEELSLADDLPIQNMEPQFVDDELDHLLVSTDAYIYHVPPHRCSRFATCLECVAGRDPHCFWDQNIDENQRGCKALPNMTTYDNQTWYQNIHTGNSSQFSDCDVILPTVIILPSGAIRGANVGSPLIIQCTATIDLTLNFNLMMFIWKGPAGDTITNNSRVIISPITSSGNTYSSSIQFLYLMEGDEGTYECNVTILTTLTSESDSLVLESLTVPTANLALVIQTDPIVGQPVTLGSAVNTVRGITSRVDFIWRSDGIELERMEGVSANSITGTLYIDTYTISEVSTDDDGRVYQFEVVINSSPPVTTTSNVTLNVTVPTPNVTVVTLNTQMVGQSLTLKCSVTAVRGITSRVDITWSGDGIELERMEGVSINSTTDNSVVYTDTYTIPLLSITDDGRVYQCEVVINISPSVRATSSITLDVFG